MFEASKEWIEANEGTSLLKSVHKALDEVVKLSECKIYSYNPDSNVDQMQLNSIPKKPWILVAASGIFAAIKFGNLCHRFSEWVEVRAVVTKASLHFINRASLPKDVILYTDEDEWSSWKKKGDNMLHIELRRWYDIMVIAPLSVNTLDKITGELCDNLLMCIARAWDYNKPFIAPAINTFMWDDPFTE